MSIYFTKPPVLLDGDTAFANDVNLLADRVDAAFAVAEAAITQESSLTEGWALVAEAWARTAENTEVEVGLYSALHYAAKASASASTASGHASTATTQAGIASGHAATATTQAGIATTQAGIATTQAGTATTQAGIATTKAGEASTSASNASGFASTATTQAGIATTQAGTATTQAGIATTKAGEASTSASNALAAKNKAEAWASEDEDVVVESGMYSALHYATKAADSINSVVAKTGATGSAVIPAGTTAQRDGSPAAGYLRFNSTLGEFERYDGTEWSPMLQPNTLLVAGLSPRGGIMGFDIRKAGGDHSIITSSGSCLDSTLTVPLVLNSEDTMVIPSVANTIYHIFVVKRVSDGVIDIQDYETEAEAASDTTISAYRWIGFVRTDSSTNVINFTMNGDLINFHVASKNIIASNIGTSYAQVDHSTVLPVSRIREIEYGVAYVSATLYDTSASDDGTNLSFYVGKTFSTSGDVTVGAWGADGNQKASIKPFLATRYFKGENAGVDLLCQAVRIWR